MEHIIGQCGLCGGHVIIPEILMGTGPPRPSCEQCGAQARHQLPVIEMTQTGRAAWGKQLREACGKNKAVLV